MNVAESTALINGRLYEAAYRKKLFFGSNGAAMAASFLWSEAPL